MDLSAYVDLAARRGASDLHLEAGLPLALRIRGRLSTHGEPLSRQHTAALARQLLDEQPWADFLERGSADFAADLAGRRCRINLLRTARGLGLAVRLLSNDLVTIDKLNLHPELKQLVEHTHGLVLVSGPTGCGKTSTQAALIQEVNLSHPAHVITIEQPIEYDLLPIRAFIRQREVGRDTPSFAQALLDALREDPDVVMVGEMRDRQTMRLTLDACETGHLVLATVHSSTPSDALQRIVSAFPAEQQPSVCAQLADSLVGVVCQRLIWRDDIGLRVPECAILRGSTAVRSNVRQGEFFKLQTAMQTGAREGQWTLERYRDWLDRRETWSVPEPDSRSITPTAAEDRRPLSARQALQSEPPGDGDDAAAPVARSSPDDTDEEGPREVYRIDPEAASLAEILEQLDDDETP